MASSDIEWTKTVYPAAEVVPEMAEDFYPEGFTEKLWAYQLINFLLQQRFIAATEAEATDFYKEALEMALKYNLVTPITSMVVTQQVRQSRDQYESLNGRTFSAGVGMANMATVRSAASTHLSSSACASLVLLLYSVCYCLMSRQ